MSSTRRGRGLPTRAGQPPENHWRGGGPGGPARRGRPLNGTGEATNDLDATDIEPSATVPVAVNDAEQRGLSENRYLEMKSNRDAEKERFIAAGLMNDPYKPVSLKDAITMVGTCTDMCPEYERYEREYQNNVDRWEAVDPTAKPRRIDHVRAVKAFQRATQGTEPIPSDLRPLPVLQKTLDYLFHTLLYQHGLEATRKFIWDRTRAIRREFTIQRLDGPQVAEMLERIARYHALCLFRFSQLDEDNFSIRQEREQLDKSLQSLIELYDDGKGQYAFPNESEFRAFRQARQAFYAAFEKIRSSKTPLVPSPTDPSDVDIIDGFYQPAQQSALPPPPLAGIPMQGSLGAAPGSYRAKPRTGGTLPATLRTNHAAAAPSLPTTKAPTSAAPTSLFGTSSIFGKGPFGPQPSAPTPAPSTVFSPSKRQYQVGEPAPAAPLGLDAAQKPQSAFAPAGDSSNIFSTATPNLFSNAGPSTSAAAAPNTASWSPWSGGSTLFAKPTATVPAIDHTAAAEAAAAKAQAEASAEAARAAAEAHQRQLRAAEAAAAAQREAERLAREAAEAEALEREREQQRQEEQERNARHEQLLKEKLRQRAEAERVRRAAEEEATAQLLAERELAAAAELARKQAEDDERARKEYEKALRLAELPLIAEKWEHERLVRRVWARWMKRTIDQAIIAEQQENLHKRREQFSATVRNFVAGGVEGRPRITNFKIRRHQQRIPDEERARMLKEESARHAKLWAAGTFTAVLHQLLGSIPLWEVWVAPASLEGASSNWLKTKFGVANDRSTLHRIPLFNDISQEYFNSPSGPGLVVLELTGDPKADEGRLGRLVQNFPVQRHYSPALLLVKFSGSETELDASLKASVQAYGSAGVFTDARVLVLSASNDIDQQFAHAVSSLHLDTTGTLVQKIPLRSFVETFMSAWEVPLRAWIGLCTDGAGFNWQLYAAVLTVMLGALNEISHRIAVAASRSSSSLMLPSFQWDLVVDTYSAFQQAEQYLSTPPLDDISEAVLLRNQLAEAASMGSEFPVYALPERIGQVVVNHWRNHPKLPRVVYLRREATSDSITQELRDEIQAQLLPLNPLIRYVTLSTPGSPSTSPSINGNGFAKKRTAEEMQWDEDADFIMTANSSVHNAAKRRKGANSHANGNGVSNGIAYSPPSPAISTISLMSTSSVGTSKRGSRLRALMDKMRASLNGDEKPGGF